MQRKSGNEMLPKKPRRRQKINQSIDPSLAARVVILHRWGPVISGPAAATSYCWIPEIADTQNYRPGGGGDVLTQHSRGGGIFHRVFGVGVVFLAAFRRDLWRKIPKIALKRRQKNCTWRQKKLNLRIGELNIEGSLGVWNCSFGGNFRTLGSGNPKLLDCFRTHICFKSEKGSNVQSRCKTRF